MRQKALVEARLPDGRVRLSVRRASGCSGDCGSCGGCGAVAQTVGAVARDPVGVEPGELVWVETRSGTVLGAAALVYLLPLLLFLGGYVAAMPLGSWAALAGVGGFALGLLPAIFYNRRLKKRPAEFVVAGRVV